MRLSTSAIQILALTFFLAACSGKVDQSRNEVPEGLEVPKSENAEEASVPSEEFSVTALQVFKKGATKVFRTKLSHVPNAPPLPSELSPLDAVYRFSSEATYSDAVATARAPENSAEDLKQLRLVWLASDDHYPSGFAWKDCTVEDPKIGARFLPNEAERKLSCYFHNDQGTTDYYFVMVRRTAELRRTPLTSFAFVGEPAPRTIGEAQVRYSLKVTNTGSQDVGEVNFESTFEPNVRLVDIRAQSGKCQAARFGDSESSVVCYLGELKAGTTTVVEFVAGPGREGNVGDLDNKNFNQRWVIRGFSRKTSADLVVPADVFKFEPLKKR